MSHVFEQILTADIGDAAYLVGDTAAGVAAIVDPQIDIERYLLSADSHGLAITHVFQTHVHEDFASGAVALAEATGALVCVGGTDAPHYGFTHHAVVDGDVFEFGETRVTVRHTPGHTPEHISLLVAKRMAIDAPFAVLSGGAMLVGTAGRTDLLGMERAKQLVVAQYRTLHDVFLKLPDGVLVYPTHVHGSPCGAAIGDRLVTTIGYERLHNPMLAPPNETAFASRALADLPPKPSYYPRLKEINTVAPARAALRRARALPVNQFAHIADANDATVIDTRDLLAFAGGHIPGALNIGAVGHLSIWAGWMLDAQRPLLLVLESEAQLAGVMTRFARTGFDKIAGWLAGGMSAWQAAGKPLATMTVLPALQLAEPRRERVILDVRAPQEYGHGHVPGAHHFFLPDLPACLGGLDRAAEIAVYCDSGYRAAIGASLLKRAGFECVSVVPGSWQAWQALGLPVEGKKAGAGS